MAHRAHQGVNCLLRYTVSFSFSADKRWHFRRWSTYDCPPRSDTLGQTSLLTEWYIQLVLLTSLHRLCPIFSNDPSTAVIDSITPSQAVPTTTLFISQLIARICIVLAF